MTQQGNPFISYLNRYTTVSSEHEAAFDEFITQVSPPSGEPLRLKTKTEQFLEERFRKPNPPSIILTGNAGDGKTYLCRQIIKTFTGQSITNWQTTDWLVSHHDLILHVVKDLSEMDETSGGEVLTKLAQELRVEHSKTVFLVAANEGRLRAILQKEQLEELYQQVDRQLRLGPDLENDRLIVLNLNQVTTSTYVLQVLNWLTDPVHWRACTNCSAFNHCPIRFNAVRLANEHVKGRLTHLYKILEHLDIHVTIRDMLIHLTYTVTGGLNCETVIENSQNLGWEAQAYRHVYYEDVWGQEANDILRRKMTVTHHLRTLDVGRGSLFEVDDFIINGKQSDEEGQAQYMMLFAPALDLGGTLFEQRRKEYLRGGASSPKPNENHPLMDWLPHIRRKLFFEWENTDKANQLFPFLSLPLYFQLLTGEQSLLERYRRELILGLNRVFTGLYITNSEHLYVTSQYAHAVEQPVPIVRIQIPAMYVELYIHEPDTTAFDRERPSLRLIVPPPPGIQAQPLPWDIDLLRFEYLVRRARGGTPDILAAECELSIRQFKDELLARFASEETDTRKVQFFAVKHNKYQLFTLWIDEAGKIHV